jgi:hypothetical protein
MQSNIRTSFFKIKKTGYTFIEVLIVTSLIMIMFPLTVYLFSSSYKNDGASKSINSNLLRFQYAFTPVIYALLASMTDHFYISCENGMSGNSINLSVVSTDLNGASLPGRQIDKIQLSGLACSDFASSSVAVSTTTVYSNEIVKNNYPYLMRDLSIPLVSSSTNINLKINRFGYSYFEYQ